jgi:hypothetical protein
VHLFIDESGVFANPSKKDEAVSAVGALCVPSQRRDSVYTKFAALKTKWGVGPAEIKGSKLNEPKVRDVCILLSKHDVKAKLVMIDLGLQEDADIDAHRERQAQALTAKLTAGQFPSLRAELEFAQARIRKLSRPLYVQLILLTELVADALQNFTLWHAARDGRELGSFHWAVDPKSDNRTEYEKLWELLGAGFLHSRSTERPVGTMEGGDYKHFDRFRKEMLEWPKTWPPPKDQPTGPWRHPDLKLILQEDFRYPPSEQELGLQLAGIVVTTLRRGLAGTLSAAGWQPLSKLLIHETRATIPVLGLFQSNKVKRVKRSYSEKLKWLHDNATSMLPHRLYSSLG